MYLKVEAYTALTAALTILPASLATFWKLLKGSKSLFGYIILSFTFAEALRFLTVFLTDFLKVKSMDVFISTNYFYILLSL
jgi:hypothetical protein